MFAKLRVTYKAIRGFLLPLSTIMKRAELQLRLLVAAVAASLLAACASIGRPEGGPRDMLPPVYVSSNPGPGALNVKSGNITIVFDENVSLDDPVNKVVVSPPQQKQPVVTSNGRRVKVELRDTLIPDMTYTIDFADAIRDLNESNILDGFAFDFSTGPELDTLAISGIVLEARTLEPAQGMTVGVYSAMTDTTLTKVSLERITKTNQLGRFTIRNLKPGAYYVYAINDMNRDFRWDRSEDIAFYGQPVVPSVVPAEFADTLTGVDGLDSVVVRQGYRYLPDDLLLTWFNEDYKAQYLLKNERTERNKLSIYFAAPSDSLPALKIIDGPRAGVDFSRVSVLEASVGLDSLTYWISDPEVAERDTLTLEARYLRTDTLDNLVMTTDTLKFNLRKQKKKNEKTEEPADSAAETVTFIDFAVASSALQDLNMPLRFTSATPVDTIDAAGIRLEMMVDTLWQPVAAPRLRRLTPDNPREFTADVAWEPSAKYRLTVDSLAVTDMYGNFNKPIVKEISTHAVEDYAALFFTIKGLADGEQAVVELLRSDAPYRTAPVAGGVASLEYLMPGSYYARLYIDRNGNGKWDTGSATDSIQPEDVFYYPKKLNLKKNWDVDQTWAIYETAVDLQKPDAIKKNKPKKNKWDETDNKKTDTDEDEDPWSGNPGLDPFMQNPNFNRNR